MCKEEGESLEHLFLHCKLARSLWVRLLQEAGVLLSVSYILCVFDGGKTNWFGINNLAKVMWKCILMWVIWI